MSLDIEEAGTTWDEVGVEEGAIGWTGVTDGVDGVDGVEGVTSLFGSGTGTLSAGLGVTGSEDGVTLLSVWLGLE